MTIDVRDESGGRLSLDTKKTAEDVVNAVLDYFRCPYEAEVEVLITDDAAIHKMNLESRGIDRSTDVLSFPMNEFPVPGDFSWLEEDEDSFDPESGELLLGDIVISADHVLAQAEAYGHSVKREYAFLLTHSMLHLLGYDHMTEGDASAMEQFQREILGILQIYN